MYMHESGAGSREGECRSVGEAETTEFMTNKEKNPFQ
jgi:hypothetical protein